MSDARRGLNDFELQDRLSRMNPPQPGAPESLLAALARLPERPTASRLGFLRAGARVWAMRAGFAGIAAAAVVVAIVGALLFTSLRQTPITAVSPSPTSEPTASPSTPAPTGTESAGPSTTPSVSPTPTPTANATPTPAPTPTPRPTRTPHLVVQPAFDTPGAAPGAEWKSLSAQTLPASSPLRTVTSVIHWRGGYVAVGPRGIWTSAAGDHWTPLNGALPVGAALVAETPGGLVALAYDPDDPACTSTATPCTPAHWGLALEAWTSVDGATWTDSGPATGISGSRVTSIVGSPIGVFAVALDRNGSSAVLQSADGVTWTATSATGPGMSCGTGVGYGNGKAIVFCAGPADSAGDRPSIPRWSNDGATWQTGVAATFTGRPAVMSTVYAGRAGFIAAGWVRGNAQKEQWWQSSDGVTWTLDPTFGPLGDVAASTGEWGPKACGVLSGDGERFEAIECSTGPDPRHGAGVTFSSWDGRTWTGATHCAGDACYGINETSSMVVFPRGLLIDGKWAAGLLTDPGLGFVSGFTGS